MQYLLHLADGVSSNKNMTHKMAHFGKNQRLAGQLTGLEAPRHTKQYGFVDNAGCRAG